MNNYQVYYNKGQEDEINYGVYQGRTEADALEEIVKHDTIRKVYDRKIQPGMRYNGMTAIKFGTPEPVADLETLQAMFDLNADELARYKSSEMFGATFHYRSNPDKFLPVFTLDDNLIQNNEAPYKYTLNFDQKLLAYWITKCGTYIQKD